MVLRVLTDLLEGQTEVAVLTQFKLLTRLTGDKRTSDGLYSTPRALPPMMDDYSLS
jgi:hypothetical protein